jgi:hypothetical protein
MHKVSQESKKRRKLMLQYKIQHLQSELVGLEDELFTLAVCTTPVDAAQTHNEIRRFMREEVELELVLKIGKPADRVGRSGGA